MSLEVPKLVVLMHILKDGERQPQVTPDTGVLPAFDLDDTGKAESEIWDKLFDFDRNEDYSINSTSVSDYTWIAEAGSKVLHVKLEYGMQCYGRFFPIGNGVNITF